MSQPSLLRRLIVFGMSCVLGVATVPAQVPGGAEAQLRELAEQNRRLQEQVQAQQHMIEALAAKLGEVQQTGERHERALQDLKEGAAGTANVAVAPAFHREQELRLTGEAGLAFFSTGAAGQFPKSEFRVDEARVFVEAPVVKDVYFFGELNLQTREASDENLHFGELYVDFENVSGRLGGPDRLVNVRAGDFYTPFGEEYRVRGVVANPLISHSLSDVWGVDEGVELYGGLGRFQYALAVQNGGGSVLRDFNADKSIAGRVGWEAAPWLQLSASAMRTGEIATTAEGVTELWFGSGFFRALGFSKTTPTFWASLYEADATARWKGGRLSAALGRVDYDDSDTAANNARRLHYGFIEGMQGIADKLYGAVRFSAVRVPRGYPVAGWGTLGRYFFSPSLTKDLKRLSLGLGYTFGPPLVLKVEYTREWGQQTTGASRNQEDFFGTEVGLKF